MIDDPDDAPAADDEDTVFGESYPDTIEGPDAAWHFGGDAQEFLIHWCELAGADVKGAALCLGENASIAILLSGTGQILTPKEIAEGKRKANMRRVQ